MFATEITKKVDQNIINNNEETMNSSYIFTKFCSCAIVLKKKKKFICNKLLIYKRYNKNII